MNPLVIVGGQSKEALLGSETGPVCVLVHGFPDTPQSLVPLARRLSADATCVLPTLRGYDECPRREPDLSIGRLGEDLLALAQRWDQRRPVTLVGHDWGAVSVYAACALAPERFRAAVTMAVPPLSVFVRNLLGRQLAMSWYMGLFQLPWLGRKGLERDLVERLWRAWSPGWEPDAEALAAAVEAMRHPVRARNALGYYRALLRALPRQPKRTAQTLKLLRTELAVPTLVLAGADDGCIAPATFAGTERAGPNVRLEVLPGVGHFMHLEAPDAVAETISCNLASLSR